MAVAEYWASASATSPDVMSCWLCGIRSPAAQMMPDGGPACGDVRWYCRDLRGCTERWTAPRASRADWQDIPPAPESQRIRPTPESRDIGAGPDSQDSRPAPESRDLLATPADPDSGPAPDSQDGELGTPGVVQPALRASAASSPPSSDPRAT
jgi:hypothetical protein